MAPQNQIYQTNQSLVEHVHKFTPKKLESYGMIDHKTGENHSGRLKSNAYASLLYETMDVESYRSSEHPSLADLLDLNDRFRLMLRHLQRLNQAIAYSESNSKQIIEAFAERAQLAYEVGQDWMCIFNVLLVNSAQYKPSSFLTKVINVLFSKASLRAGGEFYPQTEYPSPLTTSPVFMAESVLHGRHFRAKRSLSKGEPIIRELPYVRLLVADTFLRCDYCLEYKPYVLIPCSECSLVLYCSPECNMSAYKEYHALECLFIPTLRAKYSHLEQVAARITCRAIQLFEGKMELLHQTTNQWDANKDLLPSYNQPQGYQTNEFNAYAMIHNLSTNRLRMKKRDLLRDAAKALGMAKLVCPEVERMYWTKNSLGLQNLVASLYVHHLQISRVNTLYLSRAPDDPEQVSTSRGDCTPFAAVLMAAGSIFNHSCVPKVHYSLDRKGTVLFVAGGFIQSNSQLYIDYGVCNTWPRYLFKCTCSKCTALGEMRIAQRD